MPVTLDRLSVVVVVVVTSTPLYIETLFTLQITSTSNIYYKLRFGRSVWRTKIAALPGQRAFASLLGSRETLGKTGRGYGSGHLEYLLSTRPLATVQSPQEGKVEIHAAGLSFENGQMRKSEC